MKKILVFAVIAACCACSRNNIEKAEGRTFLVYPAVEGEAGNKKCRDFMGSCMLFQTDKPLFQLDSFEYRAVPTTSPGKHNQIEFFLAPEQSSAFGAIPDRFIGEGKRLALVYEGRILHAPKIKAKIRTSSLVIDFCNAHLYKIMLSSLRGEMPPDYKLGDDKYWNMCDPISEK